MGKPKGDRLRLLRASRANLSPVWALSLAEGLTELCQVSGPPVGRATDDDGVHHRLWRITQPGVVAAIADAVGSAPVVIADGHHRYETGLAYRDERRAATGDARGDFDLLLALVVELSEDQLQVQPIHRILSDLPDDFDLVGALAPSFDIVEAQGTSSGDGPSAAELTRRMSTEGAMALVMGDQVCLLRPRPPTDDPDAIVLDAALATLPGGGRHGHSGQGPGRGPGAPGGREPDRSRGPGRPAHARQDHLLRAQTPHRPGLPPHPGLTPAATAAARRAQPARATTAVGRPAPAQEHAASSRAWAASNAERARFTWRAATTMSATTSVRLWVPPAVRKNRRRTRPTTTTCSSTPSSAALAGASNHTTGTLSDRSPGRGTVTS